MYYFVISAGVLNDFLIARGGSGQPVVCSELGKRPYVACRMCTVQLARISHYRCQAARATLDNHNSNNDAFFYLKLKSLVLHGIAPV